MPQVTCAKGERNHPPKMLQIFSRAKGSIRFQRILVPLVFSGASRQVREWAVPIMRKFVARIVRAHIVVHDPITAREMTLLHTEFDPQKGAVVNELDRVAAQFGPARRYEHYMVKIGHAPTEILAIARPGGAELMVLSTPSQIRLKRFFIGRTPSGACRHAACLMISVRRT